jgi:hypothetical protein
LSILSVDLFRVGIFTNTPRLSQTFLLKSAT